MLNLTGVERKVMWICGITIIILILSGCAALKVIDESFRDKPNPKPKPQIASIQKDCRVFSKPVHTRAALFEYVKVGEQLPILDTSDSWTKVKLEGPVDSNEGYVENQCVRENASIQKQAI